jgi:hypothetical protein
MGVGVKAGQKQAMKANPRLVASRMNQNLWLTCMLATPIPARLECIHAW